MADTFNSKSFVTEAARLLNDNGAQDTIALDVGGISSITDYLVVCTVTSYTQTKGLTERLTEFCITHGIENRKSGKRVDETGWVLIDCEFVVFHLMTKEMREFYELERLWFSGEPLFNASGDGDNVEKTDRL